MANVQLDVNKIVESLVNQISQQAQRIAQLRKPRGACDKLANRNYKTYLTKEKQNGI